jgi:hypothetical protein
MQTLREFYRTTSPWFIMQLVLAELAGLAMLSLCLTWFLVYTSGFGEWSAKSTLNQYHGVFMVVGLIYIYGHGTIYDYGLFRRV